MRGVVPPYAVSTPPEKETKMYFLPTPVNETEQKKNKIHDKLNRQFKNVRCDNVKK